MRRIILFVLFLAAMTCANAQPREDLTISGLIREILEETGMKKD